MQYKVPDKAKARSLIESSKNTIDFALSLELNKYSASTIFRNIYESFRMLGDARLANKGIKSEDHVQAINEIASLRIQTKRPLVLIDELRKKRHEINYYGYEPTLDEVRDAKSFARSCFYSCYREVRREVE